MVVLRRLRLVNRRDVRVPQLDAQFGLPREFVDRRFIFAEPSPQNLHRDDFSGRLVNAAENSGERTGTDHILNTIVAVIKAGRFAARQPLDLVLRQVSEPLRRLQKLFCGKILRPKRVFNVANLTHIQEVEG